MTKDERKKYVDDNFTFLAISDAYSLIDQIYEDIRQDSKEEKTCEGCDWFNLKGRTCDHLEELISPNYYVHDDSGFYVENYEIEVKNFYCSGYTPKDKG